MHEQAMGQQNFITQGKVTVAAAPAPKMQIYRLMVI